MTGGVSQATLAPLLRNIDQRTGSRVTLLGVREGTTGLSRRS